MRSPWPPYREPAASGRTIAATSFSSGSRTSGSSKRACSTTIRKRSTRSGPRGGASWSYPFSSHFTSFPGASTACVSARDLICDHAPPNSLNLGRGRLSVLHVSRFAECVHPRGRARGIEHGQCEHGVASLRAAVRPMARRGFGSGVVLDNKGHILTTNHVVEGAEKVIVTFDDGRVLSGTVVGGDEETDVAVVRVDGSTVPPAEYANSDELKVGQPVLAIGNPLGLPGGPTVTSGVISSLRRHLGRGPGDGLPVIQTDAAVNPGNSGGPLVDLRGRVVAINSATIPYAEGIGFAIPINAALGVARQILEHGHVQRPWLGVAGYDVDRRVAAYYGITSRQGVFL